MIAIIQPSTIKGSIQAPASKSSMQRACAAALLSKGGTIIKNPGHSSDDKAALGVIKGLGAQVDILDDGSIKVISKGVYPRQGQLNCGESGLGIRMFAPIIALVGQQIRVTGQGSLLSRPMDFFDTVFPQLGIRVVSNKGKLPLEITGAIATAEYRDRWVAQLSIPDRPVDGLCRGRRERSDDQSEQSEKQALYRSYPAGDETFRVGSGEQELRGILFSVRRRRGPGFRRP